MSDKFFDELDQTTAKENSGGGGMIGKIELTQGYKVFLAGLGNDESFFPFANKKEQVTAKAAAQACIAENGGENQRPNHSVQMKLFQDSVLDRDVGHWQGDRHFALATWTPNYKEGFRYKMREAFEAAGIAGAWGTHWVKISWMADLSEPQRMRSDEPDKPEMFEYIAVVYPNKGTAKKAAEELAENKADDTKAEDTPPDMPVAFWEKRKATIIGDYIGGNSFKEIEELWEIDADWFEQYCKDNGIEQI